MNRDNVADSILDVVGKTPLLYLQRLSRDWPGHVYLKLEYLNPTGSQKDRSALQIVVAARERGELRPGQPVAELTSGNMGTALAMVCRMLGHPFTAVMSEGNSIERRVMMQALGAAVELVPQAPGSKPGQVSGVDLELVERRTQQLVRETGAWRPNQFHNTDNRLGHYRTTGQEIWEQTGGAVDVFVCAAGSGGLFSGVSQYLKEQKPEVRCCFVEPEGAEYLAGKPVTKRDHKIQGTGYAWNLPLVNSDLVDEFIATSDDQAVAMARRLSAEECVLGGFSTGANVAAAAQIASTCAAGTMIVTIAPDSAMKYLSTDLYETLDPR